MNSPFSLLRRLRITEHKNLSLDAKTRNLSKLCLSDNMRSVKRHPTIKDRFFMFMCKTSNSSHLHCQKQCNHMRACAQSLFQPAPWREPSPSSFCPILLLIMLTTQSWRRGCLVSEWNLSDTSKVKPTLLCTSLFARVHSLSAISRDQQTASPPN